MRIGEILNEKFFMLDIANHGTCQVHENPTVRNLLTLMPHAQWKIMRGLIVGPKMYWWDASLATHAQVAPYVGIEDLKSGDHDDDRDPRGVVLATEKNGTYYLSVNPEMRSHPRIERLCLDDNVVTDEPQS